MKSHAQDCELTVRVTDQKLHVVLNCLLRPDFCFFDMFISSSLWWLSFLRIWGGPSLTCVKPVEGLKSWSRLNVWVPLRPSFCLFDVFIPLSLWRLRFFEILNGTMNVPSIFFRYASRARHALSKLSSVSHIESAFPSISFIVHSFTSSSSSPLFSSIASLSSWSAWANRMTETCEFASVMNSMSLFRESANRRFIEGRLKEGSNWPKNNETRWEVYSTQETVRYVNFLLVPKRTDAALRLVLRREPNQSLNFLVAKHSTVRVRSGQGARASASLESSLHW